MAPTAATMEQMPGLTTTHPESSKTPADPEAMEDWSMSKVAGALSYLDTGSAWFARQSVSAVTRMVGAVADGGGRMVGAVADHTRSIAQEIANELSDGNGLLPVDSTDKAAEEEELARAGEELPKDLVAYVNDLARTPEVFLEYSTPTDPSFQVSDEMEFHARVILCACPELSQLRYELCPRKMSDDRFWQVYFALVQTHQAGHRAKRSSPERTVEIEPERTVEEPERTVEEPERTVQKGPWDCAFCTYANEAEATECGMCGEKKDAVPSDRGLSQSQSPRAQPTPVYDDEDGYFPALAILSPQEDVDAEEEAE